eukprot:gene30031-36269_t
MLSRKAEADSQHTRSGGSDSSLGDGQAQRQRSPLPFGTRFGSKKRPAPSNSRRVCAASGASACQADGAKRATTCGYDEEGNRRMYGQKTERSDRLGYGYISALRTMPTRRKSRLEGKFEPRVVMEESDEDEIICRHMKRRDEDEDENEDEDEDNKFEAPIMVPEEEEAPSQLPKVTTFKETRTMRPRFSSRNPACKNPCLKAYVKGVVVLQTQDWPLDHLREAALSDEQKEYEVTHNRKLGRTRTARSTRSSSRPNAKIHMAVCKAGFSNQYLCDPQTFRKGALMSDCFSQTIKFDWEKPSAESVPYARAQLKKGTNGRDDLLNYYLSSLGFALTDDYLSNTFDKGNTKVHKIIAGWRGLRIVAWFKEL